MFTCLCTLCVTFFKGGADFVEETLTATFIAGSTEACVDFTVIDDSIALEGRETFAVVFVAPNGTLSGTPSTATVTVVDDDGTFRVKCLLL